MFITPLESAFIAPAVTAVAAAVAAMIAFPAAWQHLAAERRWVARIERHSKVLGTDTAPAEGVKRILESDIEDLSKLLAAYVAIPDTRRVRVLARVTTTLFALGLMVATALLVVSIVSKPPDFSLNWSEAATQPSNNLVKVAGLVFVALVMAAAWTSLASKTLSINRAVFVAAGAPEDFQSIRYLTTRNAGGKTVSVSVELAERVKKLSTDDGRTLPLSNGLLEGYVAKAWNELREAQNAALADGWKPPGLSDHFPASIKFQHVEGVDRRPPLHKLLRIPGVNTSPY